jgi:hypothetical protein
LKTGKRFFGAAADILLAWEAVARGRGFFARRTYMKVHYAWAESRLPRAPYVPTEANCLDQMSRNYGPCPGFFQAGPFWWPLSLLPWELNTKLAWRYEGWKPVYRERTDFPEVAAEMVGVLLLLRPARAAAEPPTAQS